MKNLYASVLAVLAGTFLQAQEPLDANFPTLADQVSKCPIPSLGSVNLTVSAGADTSICAGATLVLNGTASGGVGAYAFNWSPAASLDDPSSPNPVAQPTFTTEYILTVTDENGNTATDTVVISFKSSTPAPFVLTQDTSFCTGDTIRLIAWHADSPVGYQWNTGDFGSTLQVTAGGIYSVQATGMSGCPSPPVEITVIENALPAGMILTSGNQTICAGDSVLMTLFTSPGNTVVWSDGSTEFFLWGKEDGDYFATLTSPEGCSLTLPDFITVMVMLPPSTPQIGANGPTDFCAGGTVVLSVLNTEPGVSYTWSNGSSQINITVDAGGIYSVQGKDDIFGCVSLYSQEEVQVFPPPTGFVVADGSIEICTGDSVRLHIPGQAGNSFFWNTGETGSEIWVKTAGSYSATITSAEGCTAETLNEVTTQMLPAPDISISQEGNTLIAGNANAYQWMMNGSDISGASFNTFTISHGGRYGLRVTGTNGCTAITAYEAVLRKTAGNFTYQVYPNPAAGEVQIVYTLPGTTKTGVRIINALGQTVMRLSSGSELQGGTHRHFIPAGHLQKGLYFVEFDFNGARRTERLLIQ